MTTYLKWGFDQMSFSHFYTGERSHHFSCLVVFSMEPMHLYASVVLDILGPYSLL